MFRRKINGVGSMNSVKLLSPKGIPVVTVDMPLSWHKYVSLVYTV